MKSKLANLFIIGFLPLNLWATEPSEPSKTSENRYDKDGIFYAAELENLLKNADFENGTSYWTLGKYSGGTATFFTDSIADFSSGKHAIIHSSGSFNRDYMDIQLFSFLEISQNSIYSITFKASVTSECLISISIGNGIEILYEQKLLLRPEEVSYGPFIFKSSIDDSFSFFAFNLGRTNSTISFDDVIITVDNTEKHFNKILASGGINIETLNQGLELFIQLPTSAKTDYPIIFINDQGKTVSTTKIREGSQEIFLPTSATMKKGSYTMKVFTPEKTLAYNFQIGK